MNYFVLVSPAVRTRAAQAVMAASDGDVVQIKPPTRTLEQNARMWCLLGDIAKQVEWAVDGRMQKLDDEEWKHILSAGLKHEQRVAQGINGGFVIMAQRTSQMSKRELSDLMTLIEAFGAEHGVVWSEDAQQK